MKTKEQKKILTIPAHKKIYDQVDGRDLEPGRIMQVVCLDETETEYIFRSGAGVYSVEKSGVSCWDVRQAVKGRANDT